MTTEVLQKTRATPFETVVADVRPDVPESVRTLRKRATVRMKEIGLPTGKVEEWKYTSLAPIEKERYRIDPSLQVKREQFKPFLICDVASAEVVLVNGRYDEKLSNCRALPESVTLAPIRDLWDDSDVRNALVSTGEIDDEAHPFAALNTALLDEGVVIKIPDGMVIEKPISLMFVSTGGGEERVIGAPRIVIVAGESSQIRVAETYVSVGSSRVLTVPYTQIVGRENSVVDHYRIQQENEDAFHFGLIRSHQERSSLIRSHVVTTGAAISRSDVSAVLDGEGADCTMNGLYLLSGQQHADHQTLIDHAKPHCTSTELYKGILDDRSRGVFEGKVIVRPDAQKTNASQTNNNLILSREAVANTTPQLEIYADDVKCAHGSTIGRLDEDSMFYLRTRGIGLEDAKEILTWGFASEVITGIRVGPIFKRLEAAIMSRLAKEEQS
ncbi:MAG: Fe-S cluster assembly protein SufD [Thermoanaerobaculia bacterium]|nr:Fe-S cluster assembly protein SufD [Thermoanaerobaculia bacterium]